MCWVVSSIRHSGFYAQPRAADSMNKLTRWVNEATSLLPRKVTKTGPSTRRPAQSSKIQRACDRQIRLLEREAMIAKDLVTDVRADHSACQGAFWLDSGTLCSLERLVSPSFPWVPEFHVRQAYPCALGICLTTSGVLQCAVVDGPLSTPGAFL